MRSRRRNQPRPGLGTGDRPLVPFGQRQLGGEQVELVGKVRLPRLGGEGEVCEPNGEVEAELAARGQPVEVFLVEPRQPRTDQRGLAEWG